MLNRVLQVKLVKKDKHENTPPSQTDTTLEGKAAIIGQYFVKTVQTISGAVLMYVVADTARQVLVAKAER